MVDTFDPLTIPKAMPQSIRRTQPDGFPTQYLLDYEQQLQSWMQQNTTNINQRFNNVESAEGSTSAEVSNVIQALTDGTGAYGAYITTIETKADQATAGGEVGFYAASGPAGSLAAYNVALNAGTSLAGMQIIAWSGGASSVGFYADQFQFIDSGTAQQVLTYSGGKFGFTGDVEIDGGLTIDGTITALGLAGGLSTRGSTGGTQSLSNTVTTWTDLGAPITLTVEPDALTGASYPLVFYRDSAFANALSVGGTARVEVRLLINGNVALSRSIFDTTLTASGQVADGITDFSDFAIAGGTNTFQLQYQHNFGGAITGSVFAKIMAFMISR